MFIVLFTEVSPKICQWEIAPASGDVKAFTDIHKALDFFYTYTRKKPNLSTGNLRNFLEGNSKKLQIWSESYKRDGITYAKYAMIIKVPNATTENSR